VSSWCDLFAAAAWRAAEEAERMAGMIDERQAEWLARLGNPRSDAVVRRLIASLPGQPVIDVSAGVKLTDRSRVAVSNGLQQLEDAGIVRRLNEKKWGRVWECDELLDLIEEFEQRARREYAG
jgi:DNA-binding transcriptional ArsR family regulator